MMYVMRREREGATEDIWTCPMFHFCVLIAIVALRFFLLKRSRSF